MSNELEHRSARNAQRSVIDRPLAPLTSPADRDRMLAEHPMLKAAAEAWAKRGVTP